ncbi:MAG: TrkA C-terminal domain-containing protein [Dehalococcoidia bacterium]
MIEAPVAAEQTEQPQPPLQAERRPRLLLAGRASIARQLALQLPNDWEITLVHPDAGADDAAESFQSFRGDPTSLLVLQRAGAADARALLAALPDAEENLEVCRLARGQINVPNVIAVVPAAEAAEPFRALGVEVIVEAAVVATAVRNLVERGSAAVQDVGLGQGELVQITLHPSAPVIGRRLRTFRPRGWTVAAIFRGAELVLPEPDTVLQPDDRLLLAGRPDRLSAVAEYLRVGRAQFPLPYGSTIAGPVWGKPSNLFLQEVAYLAAGVGVKELALVACEHEADWRALADGMDLPAAIRWSASDRAPADAVSEVIGSLSPGCLIVPPGRARLPRPFAGLTRPLSRALREAHVPVLVPRGTFPYQRVLLPVFRSPVPHGAVQSAFDLAEQLQAPLTTVHVQAPAFLQEHGDEAAVVSAAVDEIAAVRRRQVQHEQRVGNPLAELQAFERQYQLLVLSHRRGRRWRSLRPDISAYLTQRFAGTVLVLPMDT